jgi:hypothetical protein
MSQDAQPDMTAILEELKQTQLAYRMATEMSQFKAGFLARTSHELRSPLNSLISLQQMILSDLCENPAEEREFVAQAQASALKLVKLIDELVAVARTQQGTKQLKIQSLQLVSVLEEVYNLTHLQAANRSLRLPVSFPDPEIYILADSKRLRQVLVNLVDTAITKMDEGSICISAQSSPTSGYAHIWIDAECPVEVWSEPVDLLQSTLSTANDRFSDTPELSPGLNLLMNQTLIEGMHGRLEVVAASQDVATSNQAAINLTRLQCSIPLMLPETALPE